jgi:uncharacterized protein (UPF0332 family)
MKDKFRMRSGSFFARGANVEGLPTLQELLTARGMDYAVHKQQVSVPAWKVGEYTLVETVPVENQHVIRRSSDGVVVSPMTVSDGYGEIAPVDMLDDLDPFVSEKWATPDSAFTIRQGVVECVECITLRLAIEATSPLQTETGDVYQGYLVARNYHGRGAAAASLFLQREINGSLYTALAEVSGFKIVHRGQVRDKYSVAMKRWGDIRRLINSMASRLHSMGEVSMSLTEAERFVDKLLKLDQGKKISTQARNLRAAILDAFNMPRFGTFGKSAADMYHAVVWVGSHYTSDKSKLSDNDIVESLLEGTRGDREQRAMVLLDQLQ